MAWLHVKESLSRFCLEFTPSTRTVDVHIAWLRQKLETDAGAPTFIVTVHGIGYNFLG